MLEQLAKDFYNNSYASPPGPNELVEFAKIVLDRFIKDLEENKMTVAWNYGCDSVVFYNKNTDKKSVLTIKEEYFVNTNDKSNSVESYGRRIEGYRVSDQKDNLDDEQTKTE